MENFEHDHNLFLKFSPRLATSSSKRLQSEMFVLKDMETQNRLKNR